MTPVLALLSDRLLGEPPLSIHPVVWMGRFLNRGSRDIPADSRRAFLKGCGLWWLGILVSLAIGLALERLVAPMGAWVPILIGLLASPFLSLRLLVREVEGVEHALGTGLEAGRAQLSRIVSRDTRTLSDTEVRESALESLSENLTDSVTAPLFWLLVLGLPGIIAYRFANTADAMWGYRDRREWFGKWAAHADDALNWVPARLTGLLLCPPPLWPRLRAISRLTPSPNGGWTMGALALSLGVRLGKPGVYDLNAGADAPEHNHVPTAIAVVTRTAWIFAALAGLLVLLSAGRP